MSKEVFVEVVVSQWNELVTKNLLEGAIDVLEKSGAKFEITKVPGAWEIPVTTKVLLDSKKPDAVIALGCILMGETLHGKLLASDVGSALMKLQTESGVPVSWGILTPDTPEQALDRAGLKMGNKGREAASAALEMVMTLRNIKGA